ncbi:MAG: hypothetical protein AAF222_05785 [Pseudomonadota bacterium]
MEKDSVRTFVSALQLAFLGRDWVSFATFFKLPLVVYSAAGVFVLRTKSQLLTVGGDYRDTMGTMDVTSAQVEIENIEPMSNGRFRATVRVKDFTEDGKEVTGSLVRYFLVQTDGSYQVEMLEYLETAIPLSDMKRILH